VEIAWLMDHDSLTGMVVEAMRFASLNTLLTSEAGLERTPDAEILAFAASEQRTIYTANVRDYARLHKEWMEAGRTHSGIVVRHYQQMPARLQLRAIHQIRQRFSAETMVNTLLYLDNFIEPGH
jgi:predicted nuclease of predicted toxin-antitoxin system